MSRWPFRFRRGRLNAKWEECSVKWVIYEPTWTAIVHWGATPIARAHLTVEGRHAELESIHVEDDVVLRAPPSWWPGRGRGYDFRNVGIGSGLLETMLDVARQQGATSIGGLITDLDRVAWYERRGFTFDQVQSRVSRLL